jgi:hypothetical protein
MLPISVMAVLQERVTEVCLVGSSAGSVFRAGTMGHEEGSGRRFRVFTLQSRQPHMSSCSSMIREDD